MAIIECETKPLCNKDFDLEQNYCNFVTIFHNILRFFSIKKLQKLRKFCLQFTEIRKKRLRSSKSCGKLCDKVTEI